MDDHIKSLENLCRVCQRRAQSRKAIKAKKKATLACHHMDSIFILYGIDISEDKDHVHSKKLCVECIGHIRRSEDSGDKGELNLEGIYGLLLDRYTCVQWVDHSDNCLICNVYKQQSIPFRGQPGQSGVGCKRGRPQEAEKLYHDSHCTSDDIFASLFDNEVIEYSTDIDAKPAIEHDTELFTCSICLNILPQKSVTAGCHSFCVTCLAKYYHTLNRCVVKCPVCARNVHKDTVKRTDLYFSVLLEKLRVLCARCNTEMSLHSFLAHLCQKTKNSKTKKPKGSEQDLIPSCDIISHSTPHTW